MAVNDILFAITGSSVGNTFTTYLPESGSMGSPMLIEAQTVLFEKRLFGKENKSIF